MEIIVTAQRIHIQNLTINMLSAPPQITNLGEIAFGVTTAMQAERYELSADLLYITDHHTGLMWAAQESGRLDWEGAENYCKNFHAGGFNDWRQATDKEWETIIDRTLYKPCLPAIFKSNGDSVWTATQTPWSREEAGSSRSFFCVNVHYGLVGLSNASGQLRARPVRRAVPAGQ
jgi:hypothetical protein